jgi:hypothetical protein
MKHLSVKKSLRHMILFQIIATSFAIATEQDYSGVEKTTEYKITRAYTFTINSPQQNQSFKSYSNLNVNGVDTALGASTVTIIASINGSLVATATAPIKTGAGFWSTIISIPGDPGDSVTITALDDVSTPVTSINCVICAYGQDYPG